MTDFSGSQSNEDLDPEFVEYARTGVSRSLGTTLASKSSPRFLAATHAVLGSVSTETMRRVGLEALTAMQTPPTELPTVVEFSTPSLDAPEISDRTTRIERIRTSAYVVIGPIFDGIERLAGGVFRTRPFVGRPSGLEPSMLGPMTASTLMTQVCWLNGTLRSYADPRVFAEVAADEAVTLLDLPRPLVRDGVPDLSLLGVTRHREMTGNQADQLPVAVIDSEVALNHPALTGRVIHRRNYTPEGWSNPDSHGTAVAGLIAANNSAYGGVAPGATIYNYKVLARNPLLGSTDFEGALAIQEALEDGAAVANCSWGAGPVGEGISREARAVDTSWAAGMIVVKSAGNGGPGKGTMTTPADANGVLVVGATNLSGTTVPDYSSRGPVSNRPGPHVVAPGGEDHEKLTVCLPSGGFGTYEAGTSFAAPQVAGVAALMLHEQPDATPDEIRDRLVAAATPLDGVDKSAQGAGLVRI